MDEKDLIKKFTEYILDFKKTNMKIEDYYKKIKEKRKQDIDKMAAIIILQGYLDSLG